MKRIGMSKSLKKAGLRLAIGAMLAVAISISTGPVRAETFEVCLYDQDGGNCAYTGNDLCDAGLSGVNGQTSAPFSIPECLLSFNSSSHSIFNVWPALVK